MIPGQVESGQHLMMKPPSKLDRFGMDRCHAMLLKSSPTQEAGRSQGPARQTEMVEASYDIALMVNL